MLFCYGIITIDCPSICNIQLDDTYHKLNTRIMYRGTRGTREGEIHFKSSTCVAKLYSAWVSSRRIKHLNTINWNHTMEIYIKTMCLLKYM